MRFLVSKYDDLCEALMVECDSAKEAALEFAKRDQEGRNYLDNGSKVYVVEVSSVKEINVTRQDIPQFHAYFISAR
jgi:hypothetical protein